MSKRRWRTVGFAVIGVSLLVVWACIQRPMKMPVPDNTVTQQFFMPQSAARDVDILFVVDDSYSMENEQNSLTTRFATMINALESMKGGLPNVHIGVVSTDLGTGQYSTITYCMEVGGDSAVLGRVKGVQLGETCIGAGQRYIVDVEPSGCNIEKNENTDQCTSSNCDQSHCTAMARENEVLSIYTDGNNCPRCRNYSTTLEATFTCLAKLGVSGCGFEQQLEAMRKALDDTATPENRGFIRDSAFLSIIHVTDEDDCSASAPDTIFNPDQAMNRIDSELGFLHSFRCFEFGITCDVGGRNVGPRNNCLPKAEGEAQNYLYPISRYTAHLEALKDPLLMVIAAISGPFDGSANVILNTQGQPELQPTCYDPLKPDQGAAPCVRMKSFVGYFNTADDMGTWAYTSICATDFSPALAGIGNKIADIMSEQCLVQPFAGCSRGPAGTDCSPCLPQCTIYDIENRGQPDQKKKLVPWCGHVCTNGLCTQEDMVACNYETGKCTCGAGLSPTRFADEEWCAPLHYDGGAPGGEYDKIDSALLTLVPAQEPTCIGVEPVCPDGTEGRSQACWYLSSDTACTFDAGFKIIRGQEPPPRTFADGRCAVVPETEDLCTDGVDNDEDCAVDCDDSDCYGRSGCPNPGQ